MTARPIHGTVTTTTGGVCRDCGRVILRGPWKGGATSSDRAAHDWEHEDGRTECDPRENR